MNQPTQSNQSAEHLDPNHLGPDQLNAYIDGQLLPAEQQGIEQHLASCHACTLRVLSATKLKAATSRAGQRFAPPPETLARLTAQLHSQSEPQSQPQPKPTARIYSMRPASIRPAAWQPCRSHPARHLTSRLAPTPPNQHTRRRTPRPAPGHPLQRSHPPGHLHRPSHRQTLVPGPSPLQL
jgi:hypothetical protein